MKNLIRICDRLFIDKTVMLETSDLMKKLRKLVEERPGLTAKMKAIRDTEFWVALEGMRKGTALGYTGEEMEVLRAKKWEIEKRMNGFLKDPDIQTKEFASKLELLIRPFLKEVRSVLERALLEVDGEKKIQRLGDELTWVDTKDGWPKGVKVRKISHNLVQIEEAKELLNSCKVKIQSMTTGSHENIMAELKKLEDQVNGIDFSKLVEQEINELEYQNYRELKLL